MTTLHRVPYHWRERLLQMLLCPLKPETLRFLDAWSRCEGAGLAGDNNPLNTTYQMAPYDTTNYNSVGVKNYRTAVVGICAHAATFSGEDYLLDLWKDMQKGFFTAEELLARNEAAIKRWGTDIDLFKRVLGVEA